jgi:hypothetical protein
MKFAFVAAHRSIRPVAWRCSAPGVLRSGLMESDRRVQDALHLDAEINMTTAPPAF